MTDQPHTDTNATPATPDDAGGAVADDIDPTEPSSTAPDDEHARTAGGPSAVPTADADDGAPAAEIAPDDEDELDPELRAAQDPRSPGQLLVAVEEAEATRDEYLDGLQRSRAEFDNYRRRTTREAASARAAGVGDLAASLLEVLDDLDRTAEVASSSADEGLAAGIGAVHRKLVDALMAAGLTRVDETNVAFDATKHEAVQQVPADEPVDEPQVAQVLRPGYLHGERCLRAAMVVVRQ